MTRQLSTMVDSGLSVVRSLGILANQVENPELARILNEVRTDLEHGSSLSVAVRQAPEGVLEAVLHADPGRRGGR